MLETESSDPIGQFRYLAFISYSREDNLGVGQCWADWIQQVIQGFPVPQRFVGQRAGLGEIRAHMGDVFLDRTDLPPSQTLTDVLCEKLRQSRFLIYVGSPRAAASKYVGLEIEQFAKYHGIDRILLAPVDGDAPETWLHTKFIECLAGANLPTYVDFRVKDKHQDGRKFRSRGWTDPSSYSAALHKADQYNEREILRRLTTYERDHRDAKLQLLAALTGLLPRDLSGEAAAEEVKRQRAAKLKVIAVATALGVLAIVAFLFYLEAEQQRLKSERSLQMIGDAHERTSQLVADVLVDLREKLASSGDTRIADDAQRIVSEYFDENQPTGTDDDSIHMRSVVLNSRGYLARRAGDFEAAESFYSEALRVRRDLAAKAPGKAMFQHNVAVSLDNFGDLHAAKALVSSTAGRDVRDDYARALGYYRESLAISQKLATAPDATSHWRHDLAVSYFKVGDALYQAGDVEKAMPELQKGILVAEAVAAADPDYAKWQAHLGLYCLEIGRIQAVSARDEDARNSLERGRKIFNGLKQKGKLSQQYAAWLSQTEKTLLDVSPEVK